MARRRAITTAKESRCGCSAGRWIASCSAGSSRPRNVSTSMPRGRKPPTWCCRSSAGSAIPTRPKPRRSISSCRPAYGPASASTSGRHSATSRRPRWNAGASTRPPCWAPPWRTCERSRTGNRRRIERISVRTVSIPSRSRARAGVPRLILVPEVLRPILGDEPRLLLAPVRNTLVALPDDVDPDLAFRMWEAIAEGGHDELDLEPAAMDRDDRGARW